MIYGTAFFCGLYLFCADKRASNHWKVTEDLQPTKALMEANGQDCDWTDKKYLGPLVDYLEQGLY